MRTVLIVSSICLASVLTGAASAQQVTIGTPMNTINNSFFEGINTSWGFRGGGVNFQFGGANAQPQFGNPNAAAGLTGGAAFVGPHGTSFFNFNAAQGSRRSMVSQTPMVTVPNGGTGYFGDTSTSPFVISMIPVVGGFPTVGMMGPTLPPMASINPMASVASTADAERMQAWQRVAVEHAQRDARQDLPDPPVAKVPRVEAKLPERAAPQPPPTAAMRVAALPNETSSAELAVPGVADARRLYEQERQARQGELQTLFDKGVAAEADGKPNVARLYFDTVRRRGDGELKVQAEARLEGLRSSTK